MNSTTNRVYVANFLEFTVSVLDGSANKVLTTVHVGKGPLGVVVNPTTNRIYVNNGVEGAVSVIDGVLAVP